MRLSASQHAYIRLLSQGHLREREADAGRLRRDSHAAQERGLTQGRERRDSLAERERRLTQGRERRDSLAERERGLTQGAAANGHKKRPADAGLCEGGDYLLFRFRSTIGVIRFNFSVRNGKRWSPYAVITLMG